MNYYNINTEKISSKPKSKRTSNLWLNPDKLKEEGWLPIVEKEPKQEGNVVRYQYDVLKTQVNKVPIVKVEERPFIDKWEKVVKGEDIDHGDWIEVPYTKETKSLEEFKEQKKGRLISDFSMEAGDKYPQTIQLLVLFGVLDPETTKEVEDYYKLEGKKLKNALKLVDSASTYEEVEAVGVE